MPDGTISGGAGKGNRNPVIYAGEKSDIPIVPTKSPNNGCCCLAEAMEGRGIATGKAFDAPVCRTQRRVSASMGLEGLRDRAKQQRRENMNRVASSLRQEPYADIPHGRICAGATGNRRPYRDLRFPFNSKSGPIPEGKSKGSP